jgi:hypothetical protein
MDFVKVKSSGDMTLYSIWTKMPASSLSPCSRFLPVLVVASGSRPSPSTDGHCLSLRILRHVDGRRRTTSVSMNGNANL